MEDVTIAHAKEHLEELVARAARGEDVRIVDPKLGRVRLTPVDAASAAPRRVTDSMPPFVPLAEDRKLGHLKGKMQVPVRLMEPMSDEELRDWYGDDQ